MLPTLFLWLGLAHAGTEDALEAAVQLLEERYPDQVQRDDLYRAALQGLTARLDETLGVPGNAVLTEEEHARQLAWRAGDRVGIGVEFGIVAGQGMLLTDVYPGGPASNAGLQRGDLVVALNDQSFTGAPAPVILAVVQGARPGHTVLDVRRDDGVLRRFQVQQAPYHLGGVRLSPDTTPPIIRVPFFGAGVADALAKGLTTVPPDSPGVLLDLRDTPGGLLTEAVAAADLFLPPGTVVAEQRTQDGNITPLVATGEKVWNGSVVVLANRGTSGAAEAFVAALQQHKAAMIVGTPTAGDAALPTWHPLGADLVLQLQETRLQAPGGGTWAGVGLTPDVRVEAVETALPLRPGQLPVDLQVAAATRLMETSQ